MQIDSSPHDPAEKEEEKKDENDPKENKDEEQNEEDETDSGDDCKIEDEVVPLYVQDTIELLEKKVNAAGPDDTAVLNKERSSWCQFTAGTDETKDADGKPAPQPLKWWRVPFIKGTGVPIRNTDTVHLPLNTCFHACNEENSLHLILRDGALKAFAWEAADGPSGAGSHGFYGRSMDDSECGQNEYVERLHKNMNLCYRHHYDTGIVFELQYRATKKLVTAAQDEYDNVKKGTCTRFRTATVDRWCFHPEDAALVAMWIGPHRKEYQEIQN
ncbi:MAG: hypothetical protein GY906_29790, partial [bacterium]|nr:hypothetical protein [bacterium]